MPPHGGTMSQIPSESIVLMKCPSFSPTILSDSFLARDNMTYTASRPMIMPTAINHHEKKYKTVLEYDLSSLVLPFNTSQVSLQRPGHFARQVVSHEYIDWDQYAYSRLLMSITSINSSITSPNTCRLPQIKIRSLHITRAQKQAHWRPCLKRTKNEISKLEKELDEVAYKKNFFQS